MTDSEITVHPRSKEPTLAWNSMYKEQKVIKLNVTPPSTPAASNMLRFVCMSDTHSLTSRLTFDIPDGDVFLHAGDFTRCGGDEEVDEFNTWLGKLPHKHKIVIAGNHELSFDTNYNAYEKQGYRSAHTGNKDLPRFITICRSFLRSARIGVNRLIDSIPVLQHDQAESKAAVRISEAAKRLTNATYLQDSLTTIAGISIYGSPWQPEFCNWAFNLPRGEPCLEKWSAIPAGVDVLVTHGPPLGHGDLCYTSVRAGCVELLATVQQRVKPKYHVFGHIHEGYGITTDGNIIFVNASTCNINYSPSNPPFVFDIPIPEGQQK